MLALVDTPLVPDAAGVERIGQQAVEVSATERQPACPGSIRGEALLGAQYIAAPGPVANTDTKLLIYGLFQKGRVLAQGGDGLEDHAAGTQSGRSPSQEERKGLRPYERLSGPL